MLYRQPPPSLLLLRVLPLQTGRQGLDLGGLPDGNFPIWGLFLSDGHSYIPTAYVFYEQVAYLVVKVQPFEETIYSIFHLLLVLGEGVGLGG